MDRPESLVRVGTTVALKLGVIDDRLRIRAIVACVATAVAGCAADGASSAPDPEDAPWSVADVAGKADQESSPVYAPLPEGASLDAPFSALFAPDDPVVTLEVRLIDRVREARRADETPHEEGQNPYRIRYAVYNLRNPSVIEHLALAHEEGVDVQILIESDQLDPARHWNTADELLIARGFEAVLDHRRLTARTRLTADLVGIVGSGLMHLKTRLFETPTEQLLLTGSMNPGDEAADNDETLHLVRDPTVIARYAAAYTSVRDGAGITNVYDEAAPVNVLFTPERSGPRAATQMLRWLEQENELILLMVFSLRDVTAPGASRSLVALLESKARAGVPVYVITDRKQSDGVDAAGQRIAADDGTEDRLRAAGVHVYEVLNTSTPYTAMHHKVAILGLGERVITDAANWSAAGLGTRTSAARNVESMLFVDSTRLDAGLTGRRYLAQWMRVLARYEAQLEQDGEPSRDATVGRLVALDGWPAQRVSFVADPVETRWGEVVFVRGDHAVLGDWGASHAGVALGTDAASYPRWTGTSEIGLPLGVAFQWKLVVSSESGRDTRWESGSNRTSFAAPTPLRPDGDVSSHARWR